MHAEAIWGADPLERYGGFHHLQKDPETSFNSALPTNGTVKWMAAYSTVSSSSYSQTEALLKVSFPNVDWDTLHSVYGWSALQYQSWARGTLEITGSQPKTIALFGGGLLEFSVDGKRHFGGDLYQYNRAPSILRLNPGPHALDLRLTRDVRALGGLTNTVEAVIRAELRDDEDLLTVDHNSLLVSELAEGRLGSPWASISVQNNGAETIEIISLSGLKVKHITLSRQEKFSLIPLET
ncbi:hypothetical protein N7462_000266 [Penicillium macrosclerotiorum]|uniref:uncharacterized protein n=1 Tax=Penicillium macrosclerotiorum TaxID=303699 RepID=UPI0025483FD8|nr:uncharacterized protein N7462_000266 [Penicillium macrosclerotiorum]KAJ5698261.1 hypothetical protein N7462_000266 [Penicillium macrosclerotiorum]